MAGFKTTAWKKAPAGGLDPHAFQFDVTGSSPPVFSGTIPNQELTKSVAMTALASAPYFSNSPTSYVQTGTLPTGLSFNTSTGALTGTTAQVGTFAGIRITATNADGSAASNLFTIFVADTAEYSGSGAGHKRDARRRGMVRCIGGRG